MNMLSNLSIKNLSGKAILIAILVFFVLLLILINLITKPGAPKISPQPSASPGFKIKISPYRNLPPLPSNVPQPDEQIKQSNIDNPINNEDVVKMRQENPWLNLLPLETKNYVIMYDWQKKSLRIRIIVDAASSVSYEEQVTEIKNEVNQKLKDVGVDLNTFKLYYTFTP